MQKYQLLYRNEVANPFWKIHSCILECTYSCLAHANKGSIVHHLEGPEWLCHWLFVQASLLDATSGYQVTNVT